jgi:valyl-tRNA synthetase
MDKGLSKAVREVFYRLYHENLIYRGDYIINWCPRCHTALADLEVEHEERKSFLYYIRYRFEKQDGHLIVATTRPETLLGDTAVAVHPEDERYQNLSGLNVLLPILNKPIPVIFDQYVDREFGTGALKITPAHDPYDFEIGNTHGLERIKVIDDDGNMNELAGPYQGLDRFECRERLLEDLKANDLLEKIEPYQHSVGHCYRCKTMIEPILSKQWFVRVGPLAKKAIQAVKAGKTKITPPTWESVYFDWMNNIRDWCISRQIWWGHRIPAWYCDKCGQVIVAKVDPDRCDSCGHDELRQETDVLDTWFSSALWPFSTLGWPEKTDELKVFYPTSVLVTGFDILFFWVARMMMMGLHFMEDIPFQDVYIHALVRDAEGKKMSKSTGNVIDPLEVIDQYGTDAFRFTLAAFAAQGRDIKLSEERIEGYRHFVNKLWNSARFVLMNLDEEDSKSPYDPAYSLPEKWVLTRLGQVSDEMTRALDEYRFNDAANLGYQFVWHEFCDWYLEMAKPALYGDDAVSKQSTQRIVKEVLTAILKLLHPFMPFVTEEIWNRVNSNGQSIMKASFPNATDFRNDPEALREMELLVDIITGVRNIRGEMNIPPSKSMDIVMEIPDKREAEIIQSNMIHIQNLAKVDTLSIHSKAEKPKASATTVVGQNQVHVILEGLIDFKEEISRINKEIQKIEKEKVGSEKKLANKGFLEKAPEDVVEKVKEKVDSLNLRLDKLKQNLIFYESIDA